jgi:hypothetical protein
MSINVNLPAGELILNVKQTDFPLDDLCGFASRQNPKRGFLFVSKVLGKHYPVKPSKMKETYNTLAKKVSLLTPNEPTLFLGFAETATGLSAGIFEAWKKSNHQDSLYIHTTRYEFNEKVLFRFQEEHSHATGHIVYEPKGNFNLGHYKTLVLIDDEMTTGKTAINFIEQFILLNNCNINKIVVVCLKNWMSDEAKEALKNKINGCAIEFVSLLNGNYEFIKNENYVCAAMPNVESTNLNKDNIISDNYGRFGMKDVQNFDFSHLLEKVKGKKTLVLGTGEFAYMPFKLAEYLEANDVDVSYQSTTRSPILVGNIIGHKMEFVDNYNDNIANFVYNVAPGQYDEVFICYETNDTFNCDLDKKLNATNIFFKDLIKK